MSKASADRFRITPYARAGYDRVARFYDLVLWPQELLAFRRWRRRLWAKVGDPGRILEVGVGTGANLPYHPGRGRVVALDLSLSMLRRAKERAKGNGARADLLRMDVEALAFPNASFDAVVSSFAFCSVADPILGLEEVRRILKPGGRAWLMEHVRSQTPLGWAMDLFNPIAVRLCGENINRDTVGNLRRAGFAVRSVERLFLDVFLLIEAAPESRGRNL